MFENENGGMVGKRGDHVVKRSTAASSRLEEDVGKITSTTAVKGKLIRRQHGNGPCASRRRCWQGQTAYMDIT